VADKSENILVTHRNNILFFVVCVAILGFVFFLTVAKDLRNRRELEERLSEATRRAETQRLLAPLVAKLQTGEDGEIVVPEIDEQENIRLPEGELSTDRYEAIIGEIIRQCDLKRISLGPDLQSVLMNTDTLRADLTVRGYFSDFKRLFLTLARLPFLSGIEEFHIEQPVDGDRPEMFLKLHLQLESTTDDSHEHQ
jgi:hypothetical protein